MSEKGIKSDKMLIFTAILVIVFAAILNSIYIVNNIKAVSEETKMAMTYGELKEEDYKTQSNNVEFSAFFARDLNNDGNAERVKGTDKQITSNDTLYAELKVSTAGYLEDGKITLNGKNMSWETSIVADNIVANNYIGTTDEIKLADKVYAGSQKLFMGQIVSKIGRNINDYSQINSMTLTGTYVDDDGHRTEINITREFTVDWYGYVQTDIQSDAQDLNINLTNNEMQVTFKVINKETLGRLILKENVVKVTAPELNGYKATKASVIGQNFTFDVETGIITITKSSTIDPEGYVQNSLSALNTYNVILTYPIEAHGDDIDNGELFTKIEIPVEATYSGYNNQKDGFTKIVESTDYTTQILVEEKGYITKDKDALNITIGKKSGNKYVISKESAIKAYNGNEIEDEYYDVSWIFSHGDSNTDGKITLTETQEDRGVRTRSSDFDISKYATVTGVYFELNGSSGNISVYNDETGELLYTFSSEEIRNYSASEPYQFDSEVKKIRVETQKLGLKSKLTVHQVKKIDNENLITDVEKETFDDVIGIYSYLTASGENYNKDYKYSAYAQYSEEESEAKIFLNNIDIGTQELAFTEKVTIATYANEYNQRKWKNAAFLVEFPEDIIYSEIENVTTTNENIKIIGYDLYKENGKYFAKILTQNDEPATYDLSMELSAYINPIATTTSEKFILYAYNEDCYTYTYSAKDKYDVNSNNNTEDNVGTYVCSINIIAPESLLTSQTASNYDEDENTVIAPNTADVRKETRTADINVNILNNYPMLVSETKILGTIPYEGNTYISSGINLNSQFTTTMTSEGIKVPNELKGKVTIYYTENETADKELEKDENRWTTNPSDWTKVKRFLIDFGSNSISSGKHYEFTYTITLPEGIDYNKIAYSEHEVYCAINTSEGKLHTQLEPNKLGIRIARKYGIEISKLNRENKKVIPGAVYRLTEYNKDDKEISAKLITTNTSGKLIATGLYVESIYTLEEIKNPTNYMLNPEVVKFKVSDNDEGNLEIKVLSNDTFNTLPVIENDVVKAEILEDPRYKVNVTKIDEVTKEPISGVEFYLSPSNVTYVTDAEGKIDFKPLEQNVEYTLREVSAEGYYLLDDIRFTLVKKNGRFKIESDNEEFTNAEVKVIENEDLIDVRLNLENERKPSLIVNKVDSKTGDVIEGVQFAVDGRAGKVYETDQNGQTVINGFEENKEYTIKEIRARGYYLQEVTFKVVRDENGELKVESQNADFASATVLDARKKILSVNVGNDPIPTYDLDIVKLSEGTKDTVLKGAKFNLISEDDNSVKEYITDENGKITVKNLYAYVEGKKITGNYTLQETEAPKGYSNNAERIKFKVVKTGDDYEVQIQNEEGLKTVSSKEFSEGKLTLKLEDKPLFTLTKVDSETGKPLANVGFVIMELTVPPTYAKDVNGNFVGEQNEAGQYVVTTDENGKITLPLKNGKYAIIEIIYPEGYEESSIMPVFEVKTGDNGFEGNTITEVEKIEDLVELSKQVENGIRYENKTINLVANLDFEEDSSYKNPNDISYGDINNDGVVEGIKEELTKTDGRGFSSIGKSSISPFSGTFDGNGKEIRNIYINYLADGTNNCYIGLFGYTRNATIKNLGLTGSITSNCYRPLDFYSSYISYTGGIVGYTENTIIDKCYNKANVTGKSFVGGIAGYNGIISNCYNAGKLESVGGTLYSSPYGNVGGITLSSSSSIKNSYNIGDLRAKSRIYTIGEGEIYNSYYLDNINITTDGTIIKNGTSVESSEMKLESFVNKLNKYAFKVDSENNNNEYPILDYENNEVSRIEKIETAEELQEFSYQVNAGIDYTGITVTIENDIDMTGVEFKPIGGTQINAFTGTFDGKNNKIENININETIDNVGLFGYIKDAKIKNIEISGKIIGGKNTGGIVGYSNGGSIINCSNKAEISGTDNVGGIVGNSNGSIQNSYNNGKLEANTTNYLLVIGGIAGRDNGTIINCYNTGNIDGKGKQIVFAGGISGLKSTGSSNIVNCYNIGNISTSSDLEKTSVGGIYPNGRIEFNDGGYNDYGVRDDEYVKNCYWLDTIQLTGDFVSDFGENKTSNYMKTEEFVNELGKIAYSQDISDVNSQYPILKIIDTENVIEIEYIEDLVELSTVVNNGLNGEWQIKLINSLDFDSDESYENPNDTTFGDLNGDGQEKGIKEELTDKNSKGFTPIGTNYKNKFKGTFDGQGNKIENIWINGYDNAGLFGYVDTATVENLEISGTIIGQYAGGVAGFSDSIEINNCINNAKITGSAEGGGLIGFIGNEKNKNKIIKIENCINNGDVNGSYAGGIIGYTQYISNEITNCKNTGKIIGREKAAGICTYVSNASSSINNCYNEGEIIASGEYSYAAGIISYAYTGIFELKNNYNKGNIIGKYAAGIGTYLDNSPEITNCSNEGKIIGITFTGGIVSYLSDGGKIYNCSNAGYVINGDATNGGAYEHTGGIVGTQYGIIKIEKCYNTGNIMASQYTGGILGYSGEGNASDEATVEIKDSYNTGNITAESISGAEIGGMIGYFSSSHSDYTLIENSYNTGNITAANMSGYMQIGGLSGISGDKRIYNCYNTGDIDVKLISENSYSSSLYLGGLEAQRGEVHNSYNTGDITVEDEGSGSYSYIYTGGIGGYGEKIVDCYNTGNINVKSNSATCYVGGTIGSYARGIQNVYNTGNINVLIKNYGYVGGIVGYGSSYPIETVYNTGNVILSTSNGNNSSYTGGIVGYSDASISNAYNKGEVEHSIDAVISNGCMSVGGIVGYTYKDMSNCYNLANVKINAINRATSDGTPPYGKYVGGVAGYTSSIKKGLYNLGNIYVNAENLGNIGVGRITGYDYNDSSDEMNYYLSTSEVNVDSDKSYNKIVIEKETSIDSIDVPDIKSEEFYHIINTNNMWTHIEGFEPKLMVNTAKQTSATEIKVENKVKVLNITTDVEETDGVRGGDISGEDENPYEKVKYGDANTKEIIMTPSDGYEIEKITINDNTIAFNTDEDGKYTIPENYFVNINEDKKIVVKYSLKEQILTINKVDSDDNSKKLSGAKFTVEGITSANEIMGLMTANGDYYFEETSAGYMPNNYNISTGDCAHSYVPIDLTGLDGEYYVVVNADSYAGTLIGVISEDTTPIEIENNYPYYSYYSQDSFLYVYGGVKQSQNHTSQVLEGGKKYYLKFASTTWGTGSPYDTCIKSIRLFKKVQNNSECLGQLTGNNASRVFETKEDSTIGLSNANTSTANSYMEVDLTNKTGKYNVVINAKANLTGWFKATITEDTTAVTDYTTGTGFIYTGGITDATSYVSEPLEGGKKYYLHLSFNGSTSSTIQINSINVVKSALVELFTNNYGEQKEFIDENEIFGKIVGNGTSSSDKQFIYYNDSYTNPAANPTTSYIEIDLTNKTGDYNVLIDIETVNAGLMVAEITKDTVAVTNGSPYKHFVYLTGNNEETTYSSPVLSGGQKYYLQLKYFGGSNPQTVKVRQIKLVENNLIESFNNTQQEEFGQVTNNGDYYFEYRDSKLVPNNDHEETQLANSYIPIDLTNQTGKFAVVVKAESFPTIVGEVTENTEAITSASNNYNTNNVFMWINGGATSNGVTPDYTYVSKPLDGGKTYYLKLASDSRNGETYNASINSIDLVKYTDVETFKDNKGDKFKATDLTTDENGQIKITVPKIGQYVITETQAPEGYELLSSPIIYTLKDAANNEVTVENKSKQKLIVHHYLKTSDKSIIKVAEDEESTYFIGDKYVTSPHIDIENIELEKDEQGNYKVPNNASGQMQDGGVEVTYYYEVKQIELKISHYLEETGKKLAEDVVEKYDADVTIKDNTVTDVHVSKTYNVEENNDYISLSNTYKPILITQDKQTVDDDKIDLSKNSELAYYYAVTDSNVTIKYVDKDTNKEISTSKTKWGIIGSKYEITIKEIEGYTYIERDGDLNGEFDSENKVVILYYKKSAKVIVNYIDRADNKTIETETNKGLVGEEFTGKAKEFTGYTLVQKPTNEKVIFKEADSELNYYYEKIAVVLEDASVKVKHIDISNNKILDNEVLEGKVGDTYKTSAKEFKGYDLVETKLPSNAEGEMTKKSITVNYYYIKKVTITVRYVDEITNKEILTNKEIQLHEGDNYITQTEIIDGYELVKEPENKTGKTPNRDVEFIYYYKKKTSVEVRYVEKETGKDLLDKVVINGLEGEEYETEEKTIEYYKLISKPENAKDKMKADKTEVVYYYKAKVFDLKLEKTIVKIIIDGKEQKISNGKLAKAEVNRKLLNSTNITVKYKIKITNIGELDGGATITENIPSGFTANQEDNKKWTIQGKTATRKIDSIKAGKEKIYTIVLKWNKGAENIGTKVNKAAITNESNEAKFSDVNLKDNKDTATVILTISTGPNDDMVNGIVIVISILSTMGLSVLFIIKYKKYKNF